MTVNLFIDGAAGTTGLEIRERIAARRDIALLALDDARRKDATARAEALRDMANRADVADLNHFIAAMIQAEQLGVSISKVLRIQSDEIRIKRRQRAEEEAHRAPVKMSVVLVLLLLPSLFLIILGPSVQRVCHQLNPTNRLCG